MLKLDVSQAKGITIDVPEKLLTAQRQRTQSAPTESIQLDNQQTTVLRKLIIEEFSVNKVTLGTKTDIKDKTLYVDQTLIIPLLRENTLVKKVTIDIIEPNYRNIQTNSIMDIIPIATKVSGSIGYGKTRYLSGVVIFLTGIDEDGRQIAEFGSSHGILSERVKFGMPGTPDAKDIILRMDVVLQKGTGMERRGPISAHQLCDSFIETIRAVLRTLPAKEVVKTTVFEDKRRWGKPRILIVKQLCGQGAMHDNILLPTEPAGVQGGKSIIDLGNIPIILTPNEIKDGGIHSLT